MKTKGRTLDEKLKVAVKGDVGSVLAAQPKSAKGDTRKEAKNKEAATKVAQFHAALRLHNTEIKQWFAADPSRLAALKTNPKATIKAVLAELSITTPELSEVVLSDSGTASVDFDLAVVANIQPLGSKLLQQVWGYTAKNRENTEAFNSNPETVVRTVAGVNSASTEETAAVVRVVLIASGKLPEPGKVSGFPYLDDLLDELDQLEERRLILRYLNETLEGVPQREDPRIRLRIRR